MYKARKIYNWVKEDASRYGPISLYDKAKLNVFEKAIHNPIIKDDYLYLGDIELEFLKSKNQIIPKKRRPIKEWIYLKSPRHCIKYRLWEEKKENI